MKKNIFTFLVGGKAGQGIKKAASVAAQYLAGKGYYVFQRDDYMSLIRGGHSYSVVSVSRKEIRSTYTSIDVIVNSDERSYKNHNTQLKPNGALFFNSDEQDETEGIGIPYSSEAKEYEKSDLMFGVGAFASLLAVLGEDKDKMNEVIRAEFPERGIENNIEYAGKVYDEVPVDNNASLPLNKLLGEPLNKEEREKESSEPRCKTKINPLITGNQAIALGAVAAGLECYFAYPMTPSTSILHYLNKIKKEFDISVMQPENEIGVMNMGIGATFSGARTMVASSGGGFALMEEAYSLAGMSESPIVAVIAQRGGPSSGIPTYTEQADMQFALNVGHGDFLRIVASPGSIEEAYYLSAELMKMAWKFQTPAILLTEKYISECSQSITLGLDLTSLAYNYKDGEMKIKKHEDAAVNEKGYKRYLNTEKGISPLKFPPSKELIMWNSYEHDELGVTTEDPEMITKMHNKRNRKVKSCTDYMKKIISVNIYGEEGPLIFTWGGSTMSVLEALDYGNIQAQVIQPVFLRPFPVWELKEFKYEEVIVVEKNVTGQLSTLLNDKANIKTKHLINRYDGRPFDPKQLANDIKEVI